MCHQFWMYKLRVWLMGGDVSKPSLEVINENILYIQCSYVINCVQIYFFASSGQMYGKKTLNVLEIVNCVGHTVHYSMLSSNKNNVLLNFFANIVKLLEKEEKCTYKQCRLFG